MAEEDKEESKILEAYPAAETVKKNILDRLNAQNMALTAFCLESTKRQKRRNRRLTKDGVDALRLYQATVLSLYQYLGPHIKAKNKTEYKELERLDDCYVDLLAHGNRMKIKDWVNFGRLLTKFVYEMGVSKIEMDMKLKMEESLVHGN